MTKLPRSSRRATSPAPSPASVVEIPPPVSVPMRDAPAPFEALVSFKDIIRRHLALILVCVIIGAGAAYAFVRFVQPVYRASVSIRIDQQRNGPPVLDAFVKDLSATDVFTEQEALGSRALVERVTDSLGLRLSVDRPRATREKLFSQVVVDQSAPVAQYRIRRTKPGIVALELAQSGRGIWEGPDTLPIIGDGVRLRLTPDGVQSLPIEVSVGGFSATVALVEKKLKVTRPNRDANIIVLQFRGNDPTLVRDVPNAIVANFLATRRAAQKAVARSTVSFLRAELDTISNQLASTEAGFENFRARNQVVDLVAEADSRVRHLGDFEATRNQLEADRVALKEVLSDIDSSGGTDPQVVAARIVGYPTLFKNPAASELLHSLTEAENRRGELLKRRSMNDADVRAETRRIDQLVRQLRAIATTYLDGLTQQVAAIDKARAELGETMSTIPQRQLENTQWQRRQAQLEGVVTQLQMRLHDAQIAEAVDDPSIRIIDAAILPLAPYFPRPLVVFPAAIMCGLFAGLLLSWLIESKDIAIHTRGQLGAISGLPVLAAVPRGKSRGWRLLGGGRSRIPILPSGDERWDPGIEAYRSLRTNIAVLRNRGAQVILVTSPSKGDGKTQTATNLAVALARQGSRVVLVDADLRRGSIAEAFAVAAEPGLSDVLRGEVAAEPSIQAVQIGDHITLDLISSGAAAQDGAELLEQRRFAELIDTLRCTYDMVVIDTPPLNLVTDAAVVAPWCDGVLLVARAGATTPDALAHAIEQLKLAGGPKILGTVLNDLDTSRESKKYRSVYSYA